MHMVQFAESHGICRQDIGGYFQLAKYLVNISETFLFRAVLHIYGSPLNSVTTLSPVARQKFRKFEFF